MFSTLEKEKERDRKELDEGEWKETEKKKEATFWLLPDLSSSFS